MNVQDFVVGIDLGTTNSLVGTVVDGKARLFADAAGAELLPSVVGADTDGALLVGRAARNRRVLDPAGTAVSVKRKMGQNVFVRVGATDHSPEEISAIILGALLDRAEKALGSRPTRAIITVPAYFDDLQRQATRNAGEIAGLRIERLVNEPTAAAMTYHSGTEQRVMVYDLGGGTFDVSILDRDAGFLEVKASRGDTHLGGDDIDLALRELVLQRIGDRRAAVEKDLHAMTRLTEAVERSKIALSDRNEVRLFDPFLAGEGQDATHLDVPLRREDVEQVAKPFVEKTLRCIDDALRDAATRPIELDRVLLVGGSSKMPIVARMVSAHLAMPVQVDGDADRAVALGASILAGRAGGADIDEVLVDITPHTLAIGAVDESVVDHYIKEDDLVAVPIIERDSVVPLERTRTFCTHVENQSIVSIPIVQGEGEYVGDNTDLGRVEVKGLPPSPAHSPIAVTFRLDLSGVLHVTARHLASGREATATIADGPYRLTDQTRMASQAKVEALRAGRVSVSEAEVRATESDLSLAKAMLARGKRALETRADADETVRTKVEQAIAALSDAVDAQKATTQELTDALSDALLDMV
jgi:molecular chaperone DnaK